MCSHHVFQELSAVSKVCSALPAKPCGIQVSFAATFTLLSNLSCSRLHGLNKPQKLFMIKAS